MAVLLESEAIDVFQPLEFALKQLITGNFVGREAPPAKGKIGKPPRQLIGGSRLSSLAPGHAPQETG